MLKEIKTFTNFFITWYKYSESLGKLSSSCASPWPSLSDLHNSFWNSQNSSLCFGSGYANTENSFYIYLNHCILLPKNTSYLYIYLTKKVFLVPNLELPPLCSPRFRPGPQSEQAQVLSQFIADTITKWEFIIALIFCCYYVPLSIHLIQYVLCILKSRCRIVNISFVLLL